MKRIAIPLIISFFLVPFVMGEWKYNPFLSELDYYEPSVNVTLLINETYADSIYLNLTGTNADQDINIGTYDFYANNLHSSNSVYIAYMRDNFDAGVVDMTGDPWYLSGVSFQVADNVTATHFIGDGSSLTGIIHNDLAGLQGGGGESTEFYHLDSCVHDSAMGFLQTSNWDGNNLILGSEVNIDFTNGNVTADNYFNDTGDIEWIGPEHIRDVDYEDICSGDTCPFAWNISGTQVVPQDDSWDVNVTNNLFVEGNITNSANETWGVFNNGSCIVIGDLSYVSEC